MKYIIGCFVLLSVIFTACDDSIIIGENVVDGEQIGTAVETDFTLTAVTKVGEPINTLVAGSDNRTYMAGQIVDPIFGRYSSAIYLAPDYIGLPSFFNSTADSIILVLDYDSIGLYGNPAAEHDLKVYRVEEDFISRDSIDSAETISSSMMPIGGKTFIPRPSDSVTIADRSLPGEFLTLAPELRIPLDIALAVELLADSNAAQSDTILRDKFKGLKIEATTSGDDAMLGFDMSSSTGGGRIILYYTKNDSSKFSFVYPFEVEVFSELQQDYTGSPVESFMDDPAMGDSLLFIQGFKGLDAAFIMPDLSDFRDNRLVNKAELIITTAELSQDFSPEVFPLLRQLVASKNSDGTGRVQIDDIAKFSNLAQGLVVLDGKPSTGEGPSGEEIIQYKLNITDYVRNLADDDIVSDSLIISPLFRQETPRNAVIYGPGHSTYPAKLRIVYTEL